MSQYLYAGRAQGAHLLARDAFCSRRHSSGRKRGKARVSISAGEPGHDCSCNSVQHHKGHEKRDSESHRSICKHCGKHVAAFRRRRRRIRHTLPPASCHLHLHPCTCNYSTSQAAFFSALGFGFLLLKISLIFSISGSQKGFRPSV